MHPERIRQTAREACRLDNLGAHDRAESIYLQVLHAQEATSGPASPDTLDALHDLARCRLNGGQFALAVADFERLQSSLEREPAGAQALLAFTREQLAQCRRGLANREATAWLQVQLTRAIRRFCGNDGDADARRERIRKLATRLMARGKVALGARVMQRWIDLRLNSHLPEDEETIRGIRAHAIALWSAGEAAHAALALQAVVKLRNRPLAGAIDQDGLRQALADLVACLTATGQCRSGHELATLLASIDSRHPAGSP